MAVVDHESKDRVCNVSLTQPHAILNIRIFLLHIVEVSGLYQEKIKVQGTAQSQRLL